MFLPVRINFTSSAFPAPHKHGDNNKDMYLHMRFELYVIVIVTIFTIGNENKYTKLDILTHSDDAFIELQAHASVVGGIW